MITKHHEESARDDRPKLEMRNLADLHSHPENFALFGQLPPPEFQQLVASIAKNGVEQPIQILPDGTILRGHERARACRELGRQQITCVVRHDLVGADEATLLDFVIEDNLTRRQLSHLDRVRVMTRLLAGRGLTADSRLTESDRTVIADRLGVSTRSVTRLAAIARTPLAVQRAVNAGKLPLATAAKLASLEPSRLQQLAERIEAGESPREVAAGALADRPVRRSPATAVAAPPPGSIVGLRGRIETSLSRLRTRSEAAVIRAARREPGSLRRIVTAIEALESRVEPRAGHGVPEDKIVPT